jgi:hypothetical protein
VGRVILLDAPVRFWKCPSCGIADRTQQAEVHTQFHDCPAFGGASLPLVEVHDPDDRPRARQIAVDGAVRTERLDGSNDCTVFPAPAVATVQI